MVSPFGLDGRVVRGKECLVSLGAAQARAATAARTIVSIADQGHGPSAPPWSSLRLHSIKAVSSVSSHVICMGVAVTNRFFLQVVVFSLSKATTPKKTGLLSSLYTLL